MNAGYKSGYRRRLGLLALLAAALVAAIGLVPLTAKAAEGAVAKIGDDEYTTLDAAVKAAADGDTITVLTNCTTDAGLNLNKDLTIQGAEGVKPTITFSTYGIALWGKALTFKDCNVSMSGIGSTPYTSEWNWMTICANKNASMTLDNVTMTLDGTDAGNAHCIYFCSNNVLNVQNGSTLTIKNYKQDALEWDGGDGGYNVNITNSTYVSDNNRSGFTGTFYATIDNSTVSVVNSTGNGSNGSHFIIKNNSTVDFSNNVSHGLSTGILDVDDSTITANNNGLTGIIFNDKATFNNSKVTITGTRGTSYWNAGMRALKANASCSIASDCTFVIADNYVTGIFLDANTSLTVEEGANVTVMRNHAEQVNCSTKKDKKDLAQSGGGIVVRSGATATLSNSTKLYNNHASVAGDDIYVEDGGTITFGATQDGWTLDGDTDEIGCSDAITGWYDDAKSSRWEAHATLVHVQEVASGTLSGVCALKAAHGVSYVTPTDPGTSETEVTVSKTATNLDESYESEVTLSVPSAEEPVATDVVFVLDESSCTLEVKEQTAKLLDDLYESIDGSGATVKIGAVQYRGNVTTFHLTELDENTKTDLSLFIDDRPKVGGSCMEMGLKAAKTMLKNDTSVSDERKFVILVSDGIAYTWSDDGSTQMGVNFANADSPNAAMLASPDAWGVWNGNSNVPADWSEYLNEVSSKLSSTLSSKASKYDRSNPTADKSFVSYSERETYASTVDVALYKAYQAYQELSKSYNTFAVMAGNSTDTANFPYGPSFMSYLAGRKTIDFKQIKKHILYYVGAGSQVYDYIGAGTDNQGSEYDFDFVADASKLTMTVGSGNAAVSYSAVKIAENHFGFKKLEDGSYAYELVYEPNCSDGERFVWTFNVPVTVADPVQLTYTVQLTNPTADGLVHGVYDANGSQSYAALYTNTSATLKPVDSKGNTGSPVEFPKPTVSYTIAVTPTPTPDPTPSPSDTPNTTNDTSTKKASTKKFPAVGDVSMSALPVALVAAAALGSAAIVTYCRRKRR